MRRIKYAIGMIAVLLLFMLMGINITGVTNHKLLGLSFFGVMGIEVLLNLSWFTGYVERLKKSGNSLINLLWLLLNTFLMIDILLLFISSVVIAIIDSREWVFAHTLSAYVGLILIGVYIGFHWNMVLGSVRRALKLKPKNVLRNILLRIIVACMVFFGIKK